MADRRTFVIVGAGLAGARAAQTLRQEGFAGRVVLVGDEPALPYDRVTLSKHFLYRQPGFHGLFLNNEAFYAAHDIELTIDTAAIKIDVGRKDLVLASGKRLRYDSLLLTIGADAARWPGRGADLRGVHYLRTLADAERLRAELERVAQSGGSVVVVGAGWVGLEAAAAARMVGAQVDLVGRSDLPLAHQLGTEMGAFFRDLQAGHGVALHLGVEVAALTGSGTVEEVVLADGSVLAADLVIFGIGARPRTELATSAGLAVDDGIVTDEFLRTSVPDIYAAGDCAMTLNMALDRPRGRRSRLGHYSAAFAQGPAAARSMLGGGRPYRQVPFFFSDQYDMWMEFTGDRSGADRLVVRHLPGSDTFIAWWLRDEKVAAGMNINVKGVPEAIRALIEADQAIDPQRLADPDVPLTVDALAKRPQS